MSPIEFPVKFDNPTYSLLGVILGTAVIALFYLSHKRLRIAQKRLELVEWRKLRRIVRILNIGTKTGAVLALSFLLATPYLPATVEVPVDKATEEQMAQFGVTVMLLMDVSYSMNFSDLKPTRLEASKTMMKLLVNKMNSIDSVGFLSFAGQVYDTVFPSTERTEIIEKIDNQTLHPSTAVGTALEAAIGALESASPPGAKAIVLFSDGKNNMGENVTSAAEDALERNIPVFTVSVGTYGLGEADPLTLREISEKTNGKFYEVRNEEIESLVTSVSQISHEVKVGALKAVYDKLIIPIKDYQTPRVAFSALLVATLFLAWFTGV
jgi:Ca-activated chloride channel family protein